MCPSVVVGPWLPLAYWWVGLAPGMAAGPSGSCHGALVGEAIAQLAVRPGQCAGVDGALDGANPLV